MPLERAYFKGFLNITRKKNNSIATYATQTGKLVPDSINPNRADVITAVPIYGNIEAECLTVFILNILDTIIAVGEYGESN